MRTLGLRSCLLLTLGLAVISSLSAVAQDPDAPPKLTITRDDILRWMPVDQRALQAPSREMRELAAQVAKGTTDVRVLRAYWRSYVRLFPFDTAPDPDARRRASSVMEHLTGTGRTPLPDGCWLPIGPRNIPGRMTAMAVHPTAPDTIYAAGADGGVWKSTDLGGSWVPLGDFEVTLAMGALAIDPVNPDILYAGTGEGNYSGDSVAGEGVFKSTDGGATWTASSRFASRFHELVIDAGNTARIFAATVDGLFVTSDAGGNWAAVAGGLPAEEVTSVVISSGNPSVVLAGVGHGFGTSAGTGLYRSSDGGATWTRMPTFPAAGVNGRLKIAQSKAVPTRVYAAVHETSGANLRGVYRSDDEGQTWTQVTTPPADVCGYPGPPPLYFCWYCLTLAADPVDPDVAYIGGVPIYRTIDGGATWLRITQSSPSDQIHVDQHHLVANAADQIWAANDGGVYRSDDRGLSWSFPGKSLQTAQYYHFSTDPGDDTYAIGGAQDQGTQKFSMSVLWNKVLGGDGAYTAIDRLNPNIYYGSYQNLSMQRSLDRGSTWLTIGGGIPGADRRAFIAPFALDRSNPSTLYAGTQRLWKSTNRGTNFNAISGDLAGGFGVITAIDNCRDVPARLWVGATTPLLWTSVDGGTNWQDRTAGLPIRSITSISAHPSIPAKAVLSVGGTGTGHLFLTGDAGQTWTDVSTTLPDIHFNCVIMLEDQPTTFVAAADLGVYRSDDEGVTWYVYGSELPNAVVDWISYSPQTGTIRAATHGRGAWQLAPRDTCLVPPAFNGLAAAHIDDTQCLAILEWSPASSTCVAFPGVSYNIYRSSYPAFTVGPTTLLQAGVNGTAFVDVTASAGVPLFYAVRAESSESGVGGPANGGREDSNEIVVWLETGSAVQGTQFADDGGDTSVWLSSTQSWSVANGANSTPGGAWSYHSTARGLALYAADVCAAIATPDLVLGAAATLSYQASYNLEEEWDGVVVEISTDAGASWSDLPPNGGYPGTFAQTGAPPINTCAYPSSQGAFSGPPGNPGLTPFAVYSSDLSAYAGQSVRIRWRYSTDPGVEFEGFFLDDVVIGPVANNAPSMPNPLLGFEESLLPRFTWTDIVADRYRLYVSTDRQMAGQALVATATSGTPGILDTVPRTSTVHFYRLHAVLGCFFEGP